MTTTAWLLEWPAEADGRPTRYFSPGFGWMTDPNLAVWFVRESDALAFRATAKLGAVVRVAKHVFGLEADTAATAPSLSNLNAGTPPTAHPSTKEEGR